MLYGSDIFTALFLDTKNTQDKRERKQHPFDSFIKSGDYEISQ